MKRHVKRLFQFIFQRTNFVRAPIRAEFESGFKKCVDASFDEVRIAMEDLVSEVHRLQLHIADLKDEVALLNRRERIERRDRSDRGGRSAA